LGRRSPPNNCITNLGLGFDRKDGRPFGRLACDVVARACGGSDGTGMDIQTAVASLGGEELVDHVLPLHA